MMETCKVSIVVPVYNAEKYLDQCLNSLVNQDIENVEIIVINDGSTDSSKSICEKFALNYDRIKFIDKINEGVSVARNVGLDLANGKYITFVDADDYVEKNFCSVLYVKAEEKQSDITICDYSTEILGGGGYRSSFTNRTKNANDYKEELILRTLYGDFGGKVSNSVVGAGVTWSKFYKTDFVRKNNVHFVPGLIRAQDTIFFLSLIDKTESIVHVACALYHYRVNNESICSGNKYIQDSEVAFGKLIDEYKKIIIDGGFGKKYEEALNARIIQLLFWHFTHNCFNKNNCDSFFKKLKSYKQILNNEPYNSAIHQIDVKNLSRREKWLTLSCRLHCVSLYIIVLNIYRKYIRFKVKYSI